MKEVILVILGWILGLLGHPIVSRIGKRRNVSDLKFSNLFNYLMKLFYAKKIKKFKSGTYLLAHIYENSLYRRIL